MSEHVPTCFVIFGILSCSATYDRQGAISRRDGRRNHVQERNSLRASDFFYLESELNQKTSALRSGAFLDVQSQE